MGLECVKKVGIGLGWSVVKVTLGRGKCVKERLGFARKGENGSSLEMKKPI